MTYTTDSSTTIVGGTTYYFRVRAHNAHGWSASWSSVAAIAATYVPVAPVSITTALNNIYVRISWTAPFNNYESIDKYMILIEKSDGTYLEDTSYCDGSNFVILT